VNTRTLARAIRRYPGAHTAAAGSWRLDRHRSGFGIDWRDLWVGCYWDKHPTRLDVYVCAVPVLRLRLTWTWTP
jgi:hypothetical protein